MVIDWCGSFCLTTQDMSSRNKPLAAQQPSPAYANDPSGFWGENLTDNRTAGIASLLPANTLTQADNAARGRLLAGQIGWTPTPARWNNSNIRVSLSDAQFLDDLQTGGETPQGRIAVIAAKLQFQTTLPRCGDVLKIQAGGIWHGFEIVEMIGQHDDNDPGLTLFLEKAQNDVGD